MVPPLSRSLFPLYKNEVNNSVMNLAGVCVSVHHCPVLDGTGMSQKCVLGPTLLIADNDLAKPVGAWALQAGKLEFYLCPCHGAQPNNYRSCLEICNFNESSAFTGIIFFLKMSRKTICEFQPILVTAKSSRAQICYNSSLPDRSGAGLNPSAFSTLC